MAKIDSKKDNGKDAAKSEPASGISIRVDKDKYQKARTASGTKSLNNGDEVAVALEGLTLGECQDLADSFIGDNDFRTRYAKLNPGMQRMNIGNRIRGAVSKATVTNDKGEVTTDGVAKFNKAAKPFITAAKTRRGEAIKAAAAKAAATKKAA